MAKHKWAHGTGPGAAGSSRIERRRRLQNIHHGVVAIIEAPGGMPAIRDAIDAQRIYDRFPVLGTGFFVHDRRTILTAGHVVADWITAVGQFRSGSGPEPTPIAVVRAEPPLPDEPDNSMRYVISLVLESGISHRLDVAALYTEKPVKDDAQARPLQIADQPCQLGDEIVVCGFPFGNEIHRRHTGDALVVPAFSHGIVGAVYPWPGAPADLRVQFLVSAMINNGNSGGPVVDVLTGKVCGMVVESVRFGLTQAEDSETEEAEVHLPTGFGYAIEIHRVMKEMEPALAAWHGNSA